MSEGIVEGTERHSPYFISIRSVGEQTEILKKHVNIASIPDRRRRCGAICGSLQHLLTWSRSLAPPQDSSGSAVESYREEFVAFAAGDEAPIAGNRWRRVTRGQRGRPSHVFLGAELNWQGRLLGDPRGVQTPELRPF